MQVSESFLLTLIRAIESNPSTLIKVALEQQLITITDSGASESFDINPYKKECLLNGYDDIDYLLSIKEKIVQFEKSRT